MNEQASPDSLRQDTGEQGTGEQGTRERLLAGTLACLKEHGLPGTTSREIARASGVNLGGITYHFGAKDELVAQALLSAIREWLRPAQEALLRPGDPGLGMIEAVRALQSSFDGAHNLLPVYLEALAQATRMPSLLEGVQALFAELREFLAARTRQLQQTGFLPAWIEPEAMATLLIASGNGLALHAAIEPGAVEPGAVAVQAMQLLLAARAG